jgi:hypothetical protein
VLGAALDKMEEYNEYSEAKKEADRADRIAELMVEHNTNENGELLALVHETQGFQEVYDHKGG